jgi:predicted esterase
MPSDNIPMHDDRASRNGVLLAASLAYAALALLPLLGATILLPIAETWRGRVFGVAALCLLALPPLVVRALVSRRRARTLVAVATAVLFGGLFVGLYVASPDGHPLRGSSLHSEFLADARYRRLAVAALLPEIDQVKLATYVAPVVDPIIDRAEARRIREMTLRHYRAMDEDRELYALGSVLTYAYSDEDAGHLFAYAPPHDPSERLPTIVFLHGSAGNFKAYFYLWKRLADRARMIVVCPSFGWGDWFRPGGVEAVERARRWAVAALGADEARMFLVGLSNGGTGVTRAAVAQPGAYRGLVFISGVLEDEILRRAGRRGQPPSMPPIFVVHGTRDDRIQVTLVERSVTRLRAHGATVDEWIVDGEDHFLFFDRDDEVLARVAEWVRAQSPP